MTGLAKFKGIEFHITSAERSGGRRGAVQEYPRRDNPAFDDMGRKKRGFPIEGFIIGADYIARHLKLIDALEEKGPGELVHPHYGSKQVVVLGFNVKLTTTTDRLATFSIDFLETPNKKIEPVAAPNAVEKVSVSALAARESVGNEFLSKFTSGPYLNSISDQIRAITLSVSKAVQTIDMEAQKLALLKRRLTDLNNSVSALVHAPGDLVVSIATLFDLVESATALKTIYQFNPGTRPPGTTRSRLIEQTNFDATQRMTQRLAVIRAAEIAPGETYDSYESAVSARDELTVLLDEQAEVAADDTYPDLLQLRADLVDAIPDGDKNLPHLTAYTPRSTTCSLVLAHELYGDVARESEFVSRNDPARPGFLRGGQPLEVLSRV